MQTQAGNRPDANQRNQHLEQGLDYFSRRELSIGNLNEVSET